MAARIAAGNWKMNGTRADLDQIDALTAAHPAPVVEIMLCLPATLIAEAAARAAGQALRIGAQDCHAQPAGAHTGDIAAAQLADAGAQVVILGHSERRTDHGEDDALVGAGTVLDAETARAAQLAGAEFLVTPTVNRNVIRTANRYGTPIAVGAYTPTEALEAYQAGADAVKVFPAKTGGPDHVAAIGGPLPQIPLVPTGGVSAENAGAYVRAGAVAVGVGGSIVDHEAIDDDAYDQVEANARAVVEAVSAARD
jgi:2-dehydro-3-deoxyphosphogluconate aldolase/(4S)-4-hydroxy-2-oxoglutarate aldolase